MTSPFMRRLYVIARYRRWKAEVNRGAACYSIMYGVCNSRLPRADMRGLAKPLARAPAIRCPSGPPRARCRWPDEASSSEVRALRQAGDKGAAAVHGRGVCASHHARIVGRPSDGEARLVRAAALPPRVYPLLMTVGHAGAARARTATGLAGALRLVLPAASRARRARARSEGARER